MDQYYGGPSWAYALDSDGNPTGSGTEFMTTNFSAYGAAFDPLTGDLLFSDYPGDVVYAVQGFSPGTLTAATGNPQSAMIKTAFASPLTVLLSDPYGNPISGVTVNFAAPTSGASRLRIERHRTTRGFRIGYLQNASSRKARRGRTATFRNRREGNQRLSNRRLDPGCCSRA